MFVSIIFSCKWLCMYIDAFVSIFRSPYQRRKRSIEAKTHNNNKTQHNRKSSLTRLSFSREKFFFSIIMMPSAFVFMYFFFSYFVPYSGSFYVFFRVLFRCLLFFFLHLLPFVTFNFIFNYNFSLDVSPRCFFRDFFSSPYLFLFISRKICSKHWGP